MSVPQKTYRTGGKVCWIEIEESESNFPKHAKSLSKSLLPLLNIGKRLREDGSDDGSDCIRRASSESTIKSSSRRQLASATDLTASGKYVSDLDGLLYFIEGVSSGDKYVARASALSISRSIKHAQTRAIVRSHGLLPNILTLLRNSQRGSDEALIFVLSIAAYLLCEDMEIAERFPSSSVIAIAALLPGGDRGAVATPAKSMPQSARKLRIRRRTKGSGDAAGDSEEADVVSQARLLLDRSDILSWGIAARGSVTTADIALHTLFRILNASSVQAPRHYLTAGYADDEDCDDTQLGMDDKDKLRTTVPRVGSLEGDIGTGGGGSAKDYLRQCGALNLLSDMVVSTVSAYGINLKTKRSSFDVTCTAKLSTHQLLPSLKLLELVTSRNAENSKQAANTGLLIPALTQLITTCLGLLRKSASLFGLTQELNSGLSGLICAHRAADILLAAVRVIVNLTHLNETCSTDAGMCGCLELLAACCLVGHSDKYKNPNQDWPIGKDCSKNLNDYSEFDDGDDTFCLSQGSTFNRKGTSEGTNYNVFDYISSSQSLTDEEKRVTCSMEPPGGSYHFDLQVLCLTALTNCIELPANVDNRESLQKLRVCTGCTTHSSLTLISPNTTPTDIFSALLYPPSTPKIPLSIGLSEQACHPPSTPNMISHCNSSTPTTPSVPPSPFEIPCGTLTLPEYFADFMISRARGLSTLWEDDANTVVEEKDTLNCNDCLTKSEADELVLAGYCCLFLGCLSVRDKRVKESISRRLPGGSIEAIVRVLKAFLALQRQAEILTGEMALPVCAIIEELEILVKSDLASLKLQAEETNPYHDIHELKSTPSKNMEEFCIKSKVQKRKKLSENLICSVKAEKFICEAENIELPLASSQGSTFSNSSISNFGSSLESRENLFNNKDAASESQSSLSFSNSESSQRSNSGIRTYGKRPASSSQEDFPIPMKSKDLGDENNSAPFRCSVFDEFPWEVINDPYREQKSKAR